MKPIIYMMVGLPGSGKSSYAKEKIKGKIFSSDSLRKEVYGDEGIQGDNKFIFEELHKRIRGALARGEDCIYDATNISSKRRKHFLNHILRDVDCTKVCIFMATDINVCLYRNKKRDRIVPCEVIKNMYLKFNVPQYREGWDKIEIVRTRDTMNEYNIFKFIDYLSTVNHDNHHHLLTIGSHIQAVTSHIIDKYKLTFAGDIRRLEKLISAAMYHDIGKSYTKEFLNSKGETTDEAHYYGHENVSAYMYILYEKEDKIKEKLLDVLYVADLISLHMRPFNDNWWQKLRNIKKREYEDLCILHEADISCP